MSLPRHVHAWGSGGALGAATVALGVGLSAGCSGPQPVEPGHSGPPDAVTAVQADRLPSLAAQLTAAGRSVYYLGPQARGLDLNSFADFTEEGAGFDAFYGTCDPGRDGGCGMPVSVTTERWEAQPAGFDCHPLEPRLSVPTQVESGRLSLYTGAHVVRILDELDEEAGEPDGTDHAQALVAQLRPLGDTEPATSLPPPDPEVAAWIERACPQPSESPR